MAILVHELGSIFFTSMYPWFCVFSFAFVFLVCAVAHKTFTSDVRPQVETPPPFSKAAGDSLFTRLPDVASKLLVFQDEFATQRVKTKAVAMEWDATMAHSDGIATKSHALLARILDLESENGTLASKLQMNKMTIACLEAQVALKTESQNEILDDMIQIEGELEATKGELDAAKATIIDLETKLRDSGMQVVSLDRQLAMKTEAQIESVDEMDQLKDELKTAKAKIQEAAAQEAAMERDLVELRQLVNREETRIMYTEPRASRASQSSVDRSDHPKHAGNSYQSQLNTPPSSPRKSLLFGRANVSFPRKTNVSPTSSKFGLPSIRIPSRQGRVSNSTMQSSSVRHGVSSTLPSRIDKP